MKRTQKQMATDLGEISLPCWNNAASENHMGSLDTETLFITPFVSSFHSFGLNLDTRNSTMLTCNIVGSKLFRHYVQPTKNTANVYKK